RDGRGDPEGQEEDPAVRGLPGRPVWRAGALRRRARQARARRRRTGHRDQAHARGAGGVRQVGRRRARAGRQAQALTEVTMAAKKAKARRPARAKRPAATRVRPVPAGYHTVTPYLTVDDGARAIEFYARAFGAREKERMRSEEHTSELQSRGHLVCRL